MGVVQKLKQKITGRFKKQRKVGDASASGDGLHVITVTKERKPPEERFFRASKDDNDGARPHKRSKGLACVDFVEDRHRSRMVAVFVALAMYLVIGADLIRAAGDLPYEHAARVSRASALPVTHGRSRVRTLAVVPRSRRSGS